MKTLDKTRPYGEIYGTIDNNGRYEQDGCLFRADGSLVQVPRVDVEPKKAPESTSAKTKPAKKPETLKPKPKPQQPKANNDIKDMVIEMAKQGMEPNEIIKKTGAHRLAAYSWLKAAGLLAPKEAEARTVTGPPAE